MRPQHFACLLAVVFGGVTLAGAAVNLSYVDVGASISVTKLDASNHVGGSFTFGGGGRTWPEPPRSIRRET